MIDYKLKYQAVLFLNAIDIQANSTNIGILMNEFSDKELIPNTFQEFPGIFPIVTTGGIPIVPLNRFQLTSSNNEWVIRIGSTRIDFEKNPTDLKGSNLGDLNVFCKEAETAFKRILSKYPRKGNRVALVTRFLLQELPENRLQSIYTKLFNSPKLYKDNKPFEWNWRTVCKIQKKLNDLNEEFNFITQINRTMGEFRDNNEVKTIDRIELNFDINSLPLNVDNRFGIEEINLFFENSHTWHDELVNELVEFFK